MSLLIKLVKVIFWMSCILSVFVFGCLVAGAEAQWLCGQCIPITAVPTATNTPTKTPTPAPTMTATPTRTPAPIRTINFTESQAIFGNPGVGFQTTQKPMNEVSNPRGFPSRSMTFGVYAEEINPQPGGFYWVPIDVAIAKARYTNQKINLRIFMYDPYGGKWLKGTVPGRDTRCTSEGGGTFFAPDFDSPITQSRHQALLNAVAARYNSNPTIEHIDIRSIGSFGEWHNECQVIAGTNTPLPLPSDASKRIIIEQYKNAFPDKLQVLILDDIVARTEGRLFAGWRADCWGGHHEVDLYPPNLPLPAGWLGHPDMQSVWQNKPVLLEICGQDPYAGNWALKVDQAIAKHASLVNLKNRLNPSDLQLADSQRLLRKLGYRIVVRKATIESGAITLLIENVGIAPNYRPLEIKVGSDIKVLDRLMPNVLTSITFAASAPSTATFSIGGESVQTANAEWNNGIIIN